MKNIFIIFLFTTQIFSQNNSGKIIYKSYLPTTKEIDSTKLSKTYKEMLSHAKNLEFELIYNKKKSKFSVIEDLKSDNSEGKKMASIFYGSTQYYYNFEQSFFIKVRQNTLINIKDTINWELKNEVKQINGYECYKATYEYKFTSRKGTESKRDIIAWYCPKIPVNIGPENYNGLPGLVLELNTGLIVYVAKEINFYETELKIDFPKGKIISEEEYSKKLKENSIINER